MTFRSCDCRRVDLPLDGSRWTALLDAGEGAFAFQRHICEGVECESLMIHMPYTAEHESIHSLRVHQAGDPSPKAPTWLWDGNREKPTLSPSIACGPEGERDWHGYMRAGRLEACE